MLKQTYPKVLFFENNNTLFGEQQIKFIIKGQGVFVFDNINNNNINNTTCQFNLYNENKNDGLKIEFKSDAVLVSRLLNSKELIDKNNKQGLSKYKGAYYWFSLDSQNQRLYAGIGEARLENIVYEYTFPTKDSNEELYNQNKVFLESIISIQIYKISSSLKPLRLLRDPITTKIPLIIKNTNFLTMEHIASSKYLPKANLAPISQILHSCISGEKFVLNTEDFPDFSKAIEYSIATEGCWCNKKLKAKSNEFNKDKSNINETYLRITLGENDGESPGIPYVMEIWPVGHYSPIHSHADAHAIIRVLHGSIHVSLYPFLCGEKDGVHPFAEADFQKDDITWISPTINQTHKLMNVKENKDTCITIQCYMYNKNNKIHYDYFDYIDETGKIEQYEPDSDKDFIYFKNKMREEWDKRPLSLFDTIKESIFDLKNKYFF
jgi:hypothetical protein